LFGKNTNFDGEREREREREREWHHKKIRSTQRGGGEEEEIKTKFFFFFGLLFCRVFIAMDNVCCSWTMTASGRGQRSRPKTWTQLGMRR
jgi:hypothetical protein